MVNVEVKTWESYFFMFVDSHERNAVFMIYDSGVIGLIRKKVSESLVLLAGHQICHESTSHMYYKNMTHFAYINKGG
jgi:hypothetical protein